MVVKSFSRGHPRELRNTSHDYKSLLNFSLVPTVLVPFYLLTHAAVAAQLSARARINSSLRPSHLGILMAHLIEMPVLALREKMFPNGERQFDPDKWLPR